MSRRRPARGPHYDLTEQEVEDEWTALVVRARLAGYDKRATAEWLDPVKWPWKRKQGCLPSLRELVEASEAKHQ